MSNRLSTLHAKTRAAWTAAVNDAVGSSRPSSLTWTKLPDIITALKPFLGPGYSHGHYPDGGGMDFLDVALAREPDCLEIVLSERWVDIVKPRSLVLEHIEICPAESFLLLDLDTLPVIAINGKTDNRAASKGTQAIVEIAPGEYRDRSIWDRGFLRYDSDGCEVPLPPGTRLIARRLGGKVMIVVKGSRWNGTPATYNGIHNTMSAAQIRANIEGAL